jgi:hypothetical protein
LHGFGGPEFIAAMDQVNLFAKFGKIGSFFGCGIATTNYGNNFLSGWAMDKS